MIDYSELYKALKNTEAAEWLNTLEQSVERAFNSPRHGDLDNWLAMLDSLPAIKAASIDLTHEIRIGSETDAEQNVRDKLEQHLRMLMPWRKGPFSIFGLDINTEWHSDWKWDRVQPHITPLKGKHVLDIGCGNGYYALRSYGQGADLVLGVDPGQKYIMQFYALKKYLGDIPVHLLPLGIEDIPPSLKAFDTVFSMGVLYHRRSPLEHLSELRECLKPGGELVLETLVIEGGVNSVLLPRDRYQQMRNVWFLPSCDALVLWLQRCGFKNVRVVDVSKTTTDEQRATDWMTFDSLENFLDANDPTKTIEGYPGPMRAVVLANAP
ncbi:MAG: tRNA 5-methoxyuridine(34)/uridine 5-oxyacetic acid(34) synthase CmoB [Gammaproteobacteria bacterium]|nr:tRNA 5-methoxyuridine(34)/uridine 5-oxyacetic acid(34) synthase CmoB [Gammaproteobacteria bacterium]MCW8987588.1 tRNA 5-methoxyuridine(34)/uridine 5-oxyacetic acid(34) synthase CmoB [Gammaproteobacteria bacterium]MCW9031164.1 tRNA 5-methoxyuridine(34)/uridine 5-oxyacetic acid(34) synthase CmoB [Gammaproteobacteria bacterium]